MLIGARLMARTGLNSCPCRRHWRGCRSAPHDCTSCAVLACLACNPRPDLGSIAFMPPSSSISNPTKIAVFCEVLGLAAPNERREGSRGQGEIKVPSQPVRSRCKSTVVRSSIAGVRLFFLQERLPTECARGRPVNSAQTRPASLAAASL